MPAAPLTHPTRRGERPVRGSRRGVGTRDERTGRSRRRVCQAPVDGRSSEARPTARVPNTRQSSERRDLGGRVAAGQRHDHGGEAAPLKRVPVWVRTPPGALLDQQQWPDRAPRPGRRAMTAFQDAPTMALISGVAPAARVAALRGMVVAGSVSRYHPGRSPRRRAGTGPPGAEAGAPAYLARSRVPAALGAQCTNLRPTTPPTMAARQSSRTVVAGSPSTTMP